MLNKIFNVLFFTIIISSQFTFDCSEDLSRFKGRSESRVESRIHNVDTTPVAIQISTYQR